MCEIQKCINKRNANRENQMERKNKLIENQIKTKKKTEKQNK